MQQQRQKQAAAATDVGGREVLSQDWWELKEDGELRGALLWRCACHGCDAQVFVGSHGRLGVAASVAPPLLPTLPACLPSLACVHHTFHNPQSLPPPLLPPQ